jgi:Fe-S cluster assembly protein SufD
LRADALNILSKSSFPTTKSEAWKYTRLTKIKNATYTTSSSIDIHSNVGLDENAIKMVFVNGHFNAKLSSKTFPEGLKLIPLSELDATELAVLGKTTENPDELFTAFNTAYATDGIYLHISAKVNIEPVIELIHVSTGSQHIANIRHFIIAEAFSKTSIVQHFLSENGSDCFCNVVSDITVAKNAHLTINKLQEAADTNHFIGSENVLQQQDSVFSINTITLNGGIVRNNLTIKVAGSNCETNLNGAYILKDKQHVDNHTVVDHLVANCQSNELYKGVIDGKATAVFNGKVYVRKDAQKINAFQSNGNVLLSEDATVNSKPELEIYADDVKCSHGSTTGQLDEEAIFYLRARGIGEHAAKQLMVGAFVGEVFEKIENEAFLNRVNTLLSERYSWVID